MDGYVSRQTGHIRLRMAGQMNQSQIEDVLNSIVYALYARSGQQSAGGVRGAGDLSALEKGGVPSFERMIEEMVDHDLRLLGAALPSI